MGQYRLVAVIEVSEESPRRIADDEAACRASPPDPAALADPLVSARPNTGWDVFTDGPARYADVLDPAGLARCAELLGQQKGKKSHTLAELRDSLTRAQAALAAGGRAGPAGRTGGGAGSGTGGSTRTTVGGAGRKDETWQQVDKLTMLSKPKEYDQAIQLLKDLHEIVRRKEDTTAFTARVRELHTRYAKRPVADGTVRQGRTATT